MALLLYAATAFAILSIWSRRVQPVSRGFALALLILPLLFTGRALLTNKIYAPIDLPYQYEPWKSMRAVTPHNAALSDLHSQIVPWQQAVRSALRQGEWPLWNPHILCGDILAAAAQPGVYDPFNAIALLLPLPHALTFGAALTFFLAGFFTFAFARALGRGNVASLVAASAYMFGGMMAFFVGWPLGRAWALLPLVLYGVRRVAREQRAVVLRLALVLVIVAGHPESVLHVVFVGALYGLFELANARKKIGTSIALAIGAGVAALLVTAIYLLPFFEAAGQTVELDLRKTFYAPVDYGELISAERRAERMNRTFLAGAVTHGDPLSSRAGSITLALALAALLVAFRKAETWFFALLGIACMNASFGAWPAAHWLHELPLFDIAINERLAFAAVLSMAMLAAIAVDALDRRAALVLIAVAVALAFFRAPKAETIPLAIAAVIAFVRLPGVKTAILALLLAQRALVDGNIYPALPRDLMDQWKTGNPACREGDRHDCLSSTDARVAGVGTTLIPNSAAILGLEDVRGYEAMTNRRLAQTYPLWSRFQTAWFNVVEDPSRPFLDFLNVGYVLDGTRVIRNPNVLPRAFVPRRVQYERDGTRVLEAMKSETNFADRAWIETQTYDPHEAPNGPGVATTTREGLAYHLDADMQQAGWVVVSNTAWNGWRAYVDGKRVRTHFANHAFLGIHVPQGRHRVRLVYLPESFTRGRAISLPTIALLALVAFARKKKK